MVVGFLGNPAKADSLQLVIAADHTTGYSRTLFKHWIDADKDGCDTRAEVLIEEATSKPKVGSKCTLTGGKWLSAYDGVEVTSASKLDVDHMVPLAEAWRSGAWKWSSSQRQAYANDLSDARALIAVTLSTNRSKGDKDPALWLPAKEQCAYTENWIAIKVKYSLTVDAKEATKLNSLINSCGLGVPSAPTPTQTLSATPTITPTTTPTPKVATYAPVVVSLKSGKMGNNLEFTYLSPINWGGLPANLSAVMKFPVTLKSSVDANVISVIVAHTDGVQTIVVDGSWNWNYVKAGDSKILDLSIPLAYLQGERLKGYSGGYSFKISAYYKDSSIRDTDLAIPIDFVMPTTTPTITPTPVATPTPTPIVSTAPVITPTPTPVESSSSLIVTPGAFCAPAGAIGKSTSGVSYTCKTSPTDTRNRWRQ